MLARTRGVLGLVPAVAMLLAAAASAAAQTEEEAIRQTLVEGWVSRSADIHQPQVTVRGDTAWITYYWTDPSIDRQTGERGTSRGKSTRIIVKANGRWLCIHGYYTLVE